MSCVWRRLVAGLLVWLAASAPAGAAWLRAESPNFIVYSESSAQRLREQVLVLEDYAALLRRLTGTESVDSGAPKLRIHIVRGRDELNQVAPVSRDVGGFYSASASGIAAIVDAGAAGTMSGANEILFHEYAHHFMMQFDETAYPPWYIEGFAEFMSTARFGERQVDIGRPSAGRAAWIGAPRLWLPLERILFEPYFSDGVERARFYAQSWLLTHYLLSDPGRFAQFNRYLQALGRGDDPAAALEASFGASTPVLQKRLTDYLTAGITYRRMDRASIAQTPRIALRPLPRSADQLLLAQASMLIGRAPSEAQLARIRSEAARHGDAFARRVLAEAETLYGDGAAGERLLDELIAAAPGDAELLYLRGMRHIVASRAAEGEERARQLRLSRPWFSRAHRLDENHFPTLYRYAQSFAAEPEFRSENNLNVLLLALQLAPQVAEIRMTAAALMLSRREFAQARALLQPLASTAHSGSLAEAARAMIRMAQEEDSSVEILFDTTPDDPEEEEPPSD